MREVSHTFLSRQSLPSRTTDTHLKYLLPFSAMGEIPAYVVMDCHATARGSIPGWNGVLIELHVLRKVQ